MKPILLMFYRGRTMRIRTPESQIPREFSSIIDCPWNPARTPSVDERRGKCLAQQVSGISGYSSESLAMRTGPSLPPASRDPGLGSRLRADRSCNKLKATKS